MRRTLAVFLLMTAPCLAQTPSPAPQPAPPAQVVAKSVITAPAYAYEGGSIVLDSDQSTGGLRTWQVVSPADAKFMVKDTALIVPAARKGVYEFALFVVGTAPPKLFHASTARVVVIAPGDPIPSVTPTPGPDDPTPAPPDALAAKLDTLIARLDAGFARLGAKIDGLQPAPTPTPPTPQPPPSPGYPGHLHATLVFSLDEPSTAQLRASSVKADLKAQDVDWYVAPSGGSVAALFSKFTPADGLPVVYLTDDTGKIRGTVKAPTTKADVLAKVQAIRGGTN